LVKYPSINLKKKGFNVSFINWKGEDDPYEEFQEMWVKIKGISFKWLPYKVVS
jgi:hypothetical protein